MRNGTVRAAGLGLVAGLALGASALAQGYGEIGSYWAVIGPEDMFNSSGVRLTNLGAVLQQDRANFHRFGIRHVGDEGDPVFGNPAARALIPQVYQVSGPQPQLEAMVRAGQPFRVFVFICGYGGTPSNVIPVPEWIGDHSGCY